jgi:hypothetical protein
MKNVARDRRWRGFLLWSIVGACLALGVSQIGLVTVPVGVVLALWLGRRGGWGKEALGLVAGAGLVSALVGVINVDYRPCSSGSVVLGVGRTSSSCGGFDGLPWLIVGLVLVTAGTLMYLAVTRPPPSQLARHSQL